MAVMQQPAFFDRRVLDALGCVPVASAHVTPFVSADLFDRRVRGAWLALAVAGDGRGRLAMA
jgi:hypothetical protein